MSWSYSVLLRTNKMIAADILDPAWAVLTPSAWRNSRTGVLDGPATPIFWNIDKSDQGRLARCRAKPHPLIDA
jgi:hypothetical protein